MIADAVRRHLPLLTSSSASSFRTCPRLYQLRYELGIKPLERVDALHLGDLTHKGLEAWWNAPPGARLAAALEVIAGLDCDPFDRVRVEELLRGYDARWGHLDVEVIAVESEFVAPLVNPETGAESRTWRLAGKLDVLARVDGRAVYLEHKTSSEDITPGSTYYARLRLDAQASAYFVGAAALGVDVEAAIYDVLGKPGIKPLKATPLEARKYRKKDGALYADQREHDETLDEFRARFRETLINADEHGVPRPERWFQRVEVVRLETEKSDAAFDMWATGQQIRESQRLGRWPRNPGACSRWGRLCSFFDVCTGAASLDDRSRFRRVANPHEELELARELPTTTTQPAAA